MGGTTSTVKKIISPISNHFNDESPTTNAYRSLRSFKASPLVLSRQGSMYFDEDGDLAHEFYVEEKPRRSGSKATMRRIKETSLIPQGEVCHPYPRLHVDFPVVLYQG